MINMCNSRFHETIVYDSGSGKCPLCEALSSIKELEIFLDNAQKNIKELEDRSAP